VCLNPKTIDEDARRSAQFFIEEIAAAKKDDPTFAVLFCDSFSLRQQKNRVWKKKTEGAL